MHTATKSTLRKLMIAPPLTNRPPHQILLHTNSPGPWGTPGGQRPPGTLGATGEGVDSCKDSESSY